MNFDALPPLLLSKILKVTAESDPDTIVFTYYCRCSRANLRYGWDPNMFGGRDHKPVVKAWAYHRVLGTRYWGVHWCGKHILYVPNQYNV